MKFKCYMRIYCTIFLVTKKVTRREGKGQYQSHTKTKDKPENHKVCKDLQTTGNRHRSRGDAWTKTDAPTKSEGTTQA